MKSALRQILLLITPWSAWWYENVHDLCSFFVRKILWKKWIVLRVLWLVVRHFIVVTMGEIETAKIHVPQLFSVSKHQCVRMYYQNFVGAGVLCVNHKATSLHWDYMLHWVTYRNISFSHTLQKRTIAVSLKLAIFGGGGRGEGENNKCFRLFYSILFCLFFSIKKILSYHTIFQLHRQVTFSRL